MSGTLKVEGMKDDQTGFIVEFRFRTAPQVGVDTFYVCSDTGHSPHADGKARAKLHQWALNLVEATKPQD
jgi:hypothetical protein